MGLRIVPGTANPLLAAAVARTLRTELVTCELDWFPDGELRPVVDHLRGDDVYVIQPTGPPVSDHLVELLCCSTPAAGVARGGSPRSCRISGMPGRTAGARPAKPSVPGSSPTRWRPQELSVSSWWTRTPPRWRPCAAYRWRC